LPDAEQQPQATNQNKQKAQKKAEPTLPPSNGPFGLEAGLTKEKIDDMAGVTLSPIEGETGLYLAEALPKKNSSFDVHALRISPVVGLCQIRAVGKDVDADSFGIEIRSSFDNLKESLDSLYGKGKKEDYLMPGSMWKESKYWMMALKEKERFYSASWVTPTDAMKASKIAQIYMDARTRDGSKAFVYLQYDFINNATCVQETKQAKQDSL